MNLLLDTCVFLWLADQTEHLSQPARKALEDPACTLILSQISILEIQLKFTKGKLPLTLEPKVFVREATERHGITLLPLANEAICTTGKLPLLHNDPFDRLLIAQAIQNGLVLVTPDQDIHSYPVRVIW